MDEEQGLVSPIAGGIRGIRRSVSSSVFTGRAVPPPQPDPQTTSLLSQNSLTLSSISGQLATISGQVGSLNNSLALVQQNLALSDQLDRQREAAKQKREAILAEQGLREGKESDLERKVQFALLTPVRRVANFAGGILSRLTNFLLILAGGWLVEQTLQFIRLKSEGNVDELNKLKLRIVSDLLIVGTGITVIVMAVSKAAMLLKGLAALAFRFVVGTFIKAPFKMLMNFIKNNVKNFSKLLLQQFGKAVRSAPKTLLNVAKQPLSILGGLGISGFGVKKIAEDMKKPSTGGGLKIGKLRLGRANLIINAISGAFDFVARRKDNDNDGKPDQSMVQATSGVASSLIGSSVGFAGGMKLGAIAGTFIGGPIGTAVGGILGGILGIVGSMVVGGMAESASDRLTGVTKSEDEGAGDGSNVEPESKEQEVDMSNAELIDSNLSFSKGESVTPIKSNKSEIASNLEIAEGTPTVINIPLNQNKGVSASGGAGSSKQESQPIPNIPSFDFANTSIVMAESMFNLTGDA